MSNIVYIQPEQFKKAVPKRGRKHNLKRSRALRRKGFEFRPFDSDHIPYAWAAYKRGCFEEAGDIPEDMDAPTFSAWFVTWLYESQFEAITLTANTTGHGTIPVGLMIVQYQGQIAWPHAVWFLESTPRNRLEITLSFLVELKKKYDVLITVAPMHRRFFLHLCDYGVLRKVGLLKKWIGNDNYTLFQTVGH